MLETLSLGVKRLEYETYRSLPVKNGGTYLNPHMSYWPGVN
jgi:hypothetical protein